MAKYVALVSFCGAVSMAEGEVRDIPDLALVNDLTQAGYIKEVKKAVKKEEPEKAEPVKKAEPKKETPKKATPKKTAKKKSSKKK